MTVWNSLTTRCVFLLFYSFKTRCVLLSIVNGKLFHTLCRENFHFFHGSESTIWSDQSNVIWKNKKKTRHQTSCTEKFTLNFTLKNKILEMSTLKHKDSKHVKTKRTLTNAHSSQMQARHIIPHKRCIPCKTIKQLNVLLTHLPTAITSQIYRYLCQLPALSTGIRVERLNRRALSSRLDCNTWRT